MTPITQDTIVTVGTNGDFQTVNLALEYLSDFYPAYKQGGVSVTIKILSGFVMSEQILLRGKQFSWITIISEDTEVNVDSSALTTPFNNYYPLFAVDNGGSLPKIGAIFNYTGAVTTFDKHGVFSTGAGSSAIIERFTGGIKNAHGHALFAQSNGSITAHLSILSGAKKMGAYAVCTALIDVGGADMSNSASFGVYAIGASIINAGSTIVSGSYIGIYASEDSHINAAAVVADNCTYAAIYAHAASSVCAHGVFARNQVQGPCCIYTHDGSSIDARGIITTGSTVPVFNTTQNVLSINGVIYS